MAEMLKQRGHVVVGVSSRGTPSLQRAVERLGAEPFDHKARLPDAEVVLVGVPEATIEKVAREVAPHLRRDAVVVHFAGALGLAPLAAARAAGAGTAALHPVQACPDVDSALERLPGSAWGVTADEGRSRWAARFIGELDGLPVTVAEDARPVWHAAAVSTSNGIAALLATGEALMEAIAIERPAEVLGPLAAGAVANARAGGGGAATLTGPVVRAETATIARHLEHLATLAPDLVGDYSRVVRVIVGAAARAGRVDEGAARAMLELLDKGAL